MTILEKIPVEIKNYIFLFLSHPVADLTRQRIKKIELHKHISINTVAFHYDLNMIDFYDYLTAGTRLRLIFTLGKQWKMAGEYGFPPVVSRIQIDGYHIRLPQHIEFME